MKTKSDKLLSPAEARALIDKNMSEKNFLAMVIEYAKSQGWMVYHVLEQTSYARRTSKGFPDLVMGRRENAGNKVTMSLVIAELKREYDVLTPAQEIWREFFLDFAHTCFNYHLRTCQYHVWRPADWELIVTLLAR